MYLILWCEARRTDITWLLLTTSACERTVILLVLFMLDYCSALLAGLPAYHVARLQYIQNWAACLITKTPRYSHVTLVLPRSWAFNCGRTGSLSRSVPTSVRPWTAWHLNTFLTCCMCINIILACDNPMTICIWLVQCHQRLLLKAAVHMLLQLHGIYFPCDIGRLALWPGLRRTWKFTCLELVLSV